MISSINRDNWCKLMLLSLKPNSQTQKYIYKRVIVHAQAIAITWSKLVPDGSCQANFKREIIMSLHWYACISMNTYCYVIYHIFLEIVWWALSNANLIVQICPVIHEILANKYLTTWYLSCLLLPLYIPHICG